MSRNEIQRQWVACKTLDELCAMSARRFRGEFDVNEGFSDMYITDDTLTIAKELAGLNEAGFLTTQSQPGGDDIAKKSRGRVTSRAWVHGYMNAAQAMWVDETCSGVIKVFVTPVWDALDQDRAAGTSTTWTDKLIDTGEVVSGIFQVPTRVHHDANMRHVSNEAYADIEDACFVVAVDMVWGRERLLWDTLLDALA